MSITVYALKRPRFAFLAALLLVLSGLWLVLDFPSTEEPQVKYQIRPSDVM